MPLAFQDDIEYVDIRPSPAPAVQPEPTNFYEKWVDQSSAKHSTPELTAAETLRKLHPGYSLVVSDDYRLGSLLKCPGVVVQSTDVDSERSEEVCNVTYAPLPKRIEGSLTGGLIDSVILGSFKLTWNNKDFIVHITRVPQGTFFRTVHFFLHNGPDQVSRDLVLSVCLYAEQTHDEIWVFNQGFWTKNKSLWLELKDSSWDDVVMDEERKKALQKDIYGFFKSEMVYKKLSIPWKRGLIMYGPPGNGKTISIKVIMKTCTERGFTPLYVKSFQGFQGEEASMQNVFAKARQLAPCVLVFEDLDSLINDRNRSFFLNQLDGLEGNNGLLVIASTNHFDRLDSGLSKRPSRFDRKYLFDDPTRQERFSYAQYWQNKLKDNIEIVFPDSLAEEVADLTQGFSFAYLKEAFVSTLVLISNSDDQHIDFPVMLKTQIIGLRKELGKQNLTRIPPPPPPPPTIRSQRQKSIDGQVTNVKLSLPSPSKEENVLTMKYGVPRQLPLPKDASPIEFDNWDDVFAPAKDSDAREQPVTGIPAPLKSRYYRSSPRAGVPIGLFERQRQRSVLPAPASAYPQVMPGSLPSQTRGADVMQDLSLNQATWSEKHARRVTSSPSPPKRSSGSDLSQGKPISRGNVDPLIKIFDDDYEGEPSGAGGHV